MIPSKSHFFFFIIVLFSTLQGFYFHSLGVAPFTLLSVLMVFVTFSLFKSYDVISNISINELFVFLFYSLIFFFSVIAVLYHGDEPDLKRILAFFVVLIFSFLLPPLLKFIDLELVLKFTLIFHFSYFYLQFILYYIFGLDLDIVGFFTGISQKGWGGSFYIEGIGHIRRLGGLFNEPGTYSTFIAPLTAFFLNFYTKSSSNKIVVYLSLLSLFLTLSTFGFLFAVFISIFIVVFFKGKEIFFVTFVVSLSFILTVPYLIYRFFVRREDGLDTGLGFREVFLKELYVFTSDSIYNFLLGTGMLQPDLTDKVNLIASVNDSSLLLALMLNSGVFLTSFFFIFVILYTILKKDLISLLVFFILFASKVSIFYVFFPLILSLIFFDKRKSSFFYNKRF
ncbi:MAG: hypothetical protein NWQ54_08400 [Paraglaciecola sp.]|nr:hypothetical protein [Paraglaciecola sp.]